MAKSVSRVNGRNGESMWFEGDTVQFKSGNETHTAAKDDFDRFDILTAEDARKAVKEAREDALGAWAKDMPPTKGKTSFLVGTGKRLCWVMEVTKSQSPNALAFARRICEPAEEDVPEFKLYAAIQTPKGALFTVGSIGCALAAYFVLGQAQQPIVALILAGLSIFMFVNIK